MDRPRQPAPTKHRHSPIPYHTATAYALHDPQSATSCMSCTQVSDLIQASRVHDTGLIVVD